MKKKIIRTPLMLQMEASECGAAALGIVLGYYGGYKPLDELRQICNITRNGSNAAYVLMGAESLGLQGAGFTYSPEELVKQKAPIILHWGFNHFLVFEGYDEAKKQVYLNDPARGHRKVDWQEFEENYTGIALVLRPGENFQKQQRPPGAWRILLKELLLEKKALYFVLSLGLCLSIVNIYVPMITQVFMDDVLTMKHRPWLFEIMLGMAIALFLQMILHFFRSWCLLRWQGSLALRMCSRFFEHVLRLPIDFFQQRFTGDIVSRLRLGEEITTFVTGPFAQVALDFLVAMLYLVLLIIYDPLLTAFGVVFTCGNLVLTYFVYQWLKEQQMRTQLEAGRMSGLAAVGIASIESLKANGIENDFFVKWVNKNARYLDMLQHQEYIAQFVSFIPSVLAGVNSALIMMLGGFEIMDGVMTVGIFVAFQNLMSNFQQPVGKIAAMLQNIQQTEAQILKLEDISRYTALPEKKLDTSMPSRLKGHVEMRNVSYAYGRVGKPLIKRLNFEIKPGRRLAIVGKSGSGKSTTAKLVSGLCQPWLGEIYYDGIPLGEINQDILANSMSVVEQNPVLLEGTVAENISLFDANISRQEIIQAAKDACIHEEIAVLRGGYDFMVAEGGANFSGGQRQRLEIARALATNPSFLVFDEATAELDAVTEKKIMDNIRRRGCSCLIVAHRLSTIRDCDEIIVLSNGRVVERGNHDSLMAKDGHYKKLLMEQ